jgi:uncharacterized membrane protein
MTIIEDNFKRVIPIANKLRHCLVLALLAAVNISILFKVPFFRQTLGFLFFSVVPGWLLLTVLKLNKLEFIKKLTLSFCLSVVLLMFGALAVNGLYPRVTEPLSTRPLLISFNLVIVLLLGLSWCGEKGRTAAPGIIEQAPQTNGKLNFLALSACIFPVLSVGGSYMMNIFHSNLVTLVMLGLIPVYVVLLVIYNKKLPALAFPFAVAMIALSLLLMYSLTSNYIICYADPDMQYYVFRLTASAGHWDMANFSGAYNACLSVTILPTVYYNLLHISLESTFKVIFPILFSVTPVAVYLIVKK